MMLFLLALGVFALAGLPMLWFGVRALLRFRGTRVVACPETESPAAVRTDALHAAASAAVGTPALRLASCSRWPERRACGQPCLSQLEEAAADCLVRTTLV